MPIVKKYKAKVVSVNNPIEGLYKVSFRSEKKFNYLPGQFLHLAIDDYDGVGQWPDSRCFSMQSNADEECITITYAVKGAFTCRMQNELKRDKEVWLKLPYGDIFQRGHVRDKSVFIAGGTGVTPFLSLFSHGSFSEFTNPKIYLGFKSKEYNFYESELNCIRNTSHKIKVIYENMVGMLNIREIFEENGLTVYYLSGPPLMLKEFKSTLIKFGVLEENIVTDDWI